MNFVNAVKAAYGYEIVVSEHLPKEQWEQVRFPRSKKRRIRNKWRKRQSNYAMVPVQYAYLFHGRTLVCSPETLAMIKKKVIEAKIQQASYLAERAGIRPVVLPW